MTWLCCCWCSSCFLGVSTPLSYSRAGFVSRKYFYDFTLLLTVIKLCARTVCSVDVRFRPFLAFVSVVPGLVSAVLSFWLHWVIDLPLRLIPWFAVDSISSDLFCLHDLLLFYLIGLSQMGWKVPFIWVVGPCVAFNFPCYTYIYINYCFNSAFAPVVIFSLSLIVSCFQASQLVGFSIFIYRIV